MFIACIFLNNFRFLLSKIFTKLAYLTLKPVPITSFLSTNVRRQRQMIPQFFFVVFFSGLILVPGKTLMICSRDHNCIEIERTESLSYFIFPGARYKHARCSFMPYFFSVT